MPSAGHVAGSGAGAAPGGRERLVAALSEPRRDRRGGLFSAAVVLSLLAHVPALPILARMAPRYGRGELAHLELLMEALSRAEPPQGIPGAPPRSGDGPMHLRAAAESPVSIADAAPSRSVMRLSGTLDLHEKLPALPEASWGSDTGQAPDRAEVARKWYAWYCKRLRARIASAYPFEMLAKEGIKGKISFRLELEPDGSVRQLTVVESDHPVMTEALKLAVKRASPLPGYRELGLDWLPPLNLTITH